MAHEVTQRADGTAEAAFAKIPAWHGLGTIVNHAMTSIEALRQAQMDWEVEQRPLFLADSIPVNGYFANVREDNKEVLGVVGSRYQIVQNRDAFDFLDKLVEDEIIRYEAAISLKSGRQIVLLARYPGTDPVVDGDKLEKFILFTNSHDGSGAITVMPTSVRVVCMNTLRLALAGRKKADSLSIRHTGSIDTKLAAARKVLGIVSKQFTEHAEMARKMTKVELTAEKWADYLDAVVPLPDDSNKRAKNRLVDVRLDITKIFRNDYRQNIPGIQGTVWAGFNAITQHVDHSDPARKASDETKFLSTTFGSGNDIKQNAWNRAVELVA